MVGALKQSLDNNYGCSNIDSDIEEGFEHDILNGP